MKSVKIGGKRIGKGEPTFIIAEIGYNFENVEQAKQSIEAAVEAGADAVKFQTFKADTIVTRDIMFPPEAGGTSQYEEFKRFEMSEEMHREVFGYARQRGIIAFSTPSHPDDVELLERIGVPAYKIGSDDLTNVPFLQYVARKGRPMIVSTGMGTLAEVENAIETIRGEGNEHIVMLQCVSSYPITDLSTVNLRAIQTIERAFDVPVGLSDHTTTISIPIAAVALGAVAVERHFTLSKDLSVPDAFFSADTGELKTIVRGIREVEMALGDGIKRPTHAETEMRRETRKGLIAACDIPAGTRLTEEMIIIKRPGTGIAPKCLDLIVGRTARVDIKVDTVITWDMI
ncbi:MAG: N-acetylneuraminate synthase family protein [Deltaproteobacteria bacterium]|nr:N-acetylneuraminate synthase family protein [Deltaproteobacteria bacterium]